MTDLHPGVRVKILRNRSGMGLRELARKSGVSPAMLSRFERADGDATISLVNKIRMALNLSWDELMSVECSHEYACIFCNEPIVQGSA